MRVYNQAGSYKTLFEPDDTHAICLYDQVAEKFNLKSYHDHRFFLLKNGQGM